MSPKASDSETGSVEKSHDGANAGTKEWKTAPFFVKPGPQLGHRVGQSFKRWWPLHLFIFAACTLLITLPLVYVGFPTYAQQDTDSTQVTVQGLALTNPTLDSFVFGLNSTLSPKTIFTPQLDEFNLTFALAGAANPFVTVSVPSVHFVKPTLVNISDQRVSIQNQDAWRDYLKAAFANDTYSVHSYGRPGLQLGALPHTNVNFDKTIEIPGLGGLKQINVHDIVINATTTQNNFRANVSIYNPSNSRFELGNVTYRNYVGPNMTYIGDSYINNLVLAPGNNTLPTVASTQQGPIIAALSERPSCQTGMITTTLVPSNITYNGVVLDYYLASLANITQDLPLGQAIEAATMGISKFYCPPGV